MRAQAPVGFVCSSFDPEEQTNTSQKQNHGKRAYFLPCSSFAFFETSR